MAFAGQCHGLGPAGVGAQRHRLEDSWWWKTRCVSKLRVNFLFHRISPRNYCTSSGVSNFETSPCVPMCAFETSLKCEACKIQKTPPQSTEMEVLQKGVYLGMTIHQGFIFTWFLGKDGPKKPPSCHYLRSQMLRWWAPQVGGWIFWGALRS